MIKCIFAALFIALCAYGCNIAGTASNYFEQYRGGYSHE